MLVFWENDDVILNFGLERLLMMLHESCLVLGPPPRMLWCAGECEISFNEPTISRITKENSSKTLN